MQVPLLKGDKVDNADYRDALLVNMIAVKKEIKGSSGYIKSHPGLTKVTDGIGFDRGANWNERFEDHFRVSRDKLIQISGSGTVTELGDIPGSEQVSFATSFNTQAVVADGRYFLYDPTNGFREVVDPNLGSPIDITWIDGYYFFTDGENLYHTDIGDESVIDPLNFATSEFSPDPTLGVAKTQDNQVVVFNRFTTEYFINRATEQFAFQRVPGKAVNAGTVGTHCKAYMDGKFFILGGRKDESPSVHIISPGRVDAVATREIDQILRSYTETELKAVVMESRVDKRDKFILIHLPDRTLLFNHTVAEAFGLEQAWTILKGGTSNAPWRGKNGIYDQRRAGSGAWVYGDRVTSDIAFLDDDTTLSYGEKNEFIFYTPFLMLDEVSIDEIEIQTIPGFTNDEPATLAVSRTENGLTYGLEVFRIYGKTSAYRQRYIAYRLGYVNNFVGFKFRSYGGARLAFSGMNIEYG